MSDVIATPEAPAIVLDPTSTAKPPAPAPTPVQTGEPQEKPSWLDARLERERKSVLKDLGLESLDDGKKAVAAAKAADEAKKTDAQRVAEFEASLKAERAAGAEKDKALGALAKEQLGALTEAQRNAVMAVAGEDATKQISTIVALRPTWAGAAVPAATVQTPAVKDTATANTAPKDGGSSTAPPDHKAIHADMQKTNPVAAARYALKNRIFE